MPVYIGIDWSEKKHDVVFLNEAGAILAQLSMSHSPEGLLNLEKSRLYAGLEVEECWVALETAHNLVIDFLCRGRYGSSGARTDRKDGRLIADVLRTDRARLHPWRPDSLLTRQLRAKVSLINHLTRSTVRLSNRLRAVLLRYYPAAVEVFSSLTVQTALHFLQSYPTPDSAARLTFPQFETFVRQQGYRRQEKVAECFARLEATPETVLVYQDEVPLLANSLLHVVQAKNQAGRELSSLFKQHPDRAIFASLPGAGQLLAPASSLRYRGPASCWPRPCWPSLAMTAPVSPARPASKPWLAPAR
jgi:transposase